MLGLRFVYICLWGSECVRKIITSYRLQTGRTVAPHLVKEICEVHSLVNRQFARR